MVSGGEILQHTTSLDAESQSIEDTEKKVKSGLDGMVTKVAKSEGQQSLHQEHFMQTVKALQFIRKNLKIVDASEIQHLRVQLNPP